MRLTIFHISRSYHKIVYQPVARFKLTVALAVLQLHGEIGASPCGATRGLQFPERNYFMKETRKVWSEGMDVIGSVLKFGLLIQRVRIPRGQSVSMALGLIAATATMTVRAQTASTPPTAEADTTQLNEVVVTAQRRDERAVDVPITITAVDSAQLSTANVQVLTDVAKVSPDLQFASNGTFVQPIIRGVGTLLATAGSGSNVGTYIDGFLSPNPLANSFQLLNVDSIQVLKGPQGTLFGRNTTGGAILVTTAAPSTETSAVADVSYGNFNAQRYQGYFTTGLTDKIAFDVEAIDSKGNGFLSDISTGNNTVGAYDNWTVRTGLNFQVSDSVSILLRYEHAQVNDPTGTLDGVYVVNGQPQTLGRLFPGTGIATAPDQVSFTPPAPFAITTTNNPQLTVTADLDFATLKSYTQWRQDISNQGLDLDETTAPIYSIHIPVRDTTVTQEFLLSSKPGGAFQWTTGLFYLYDADEFTGTQASVGSDAPYTQFADSGVTSVSYAAYADGTYQVAPQFFITAGLRVTRDEDRDAFFYTPAPTGFLRTDVASITSDHVTPRVVLRYKPDDDSSVYLSWTDGYKAPLLNVGGGTLQGIQVAPEKIEAYEVGYKYAQGPLSFDVSAFYYDYKDLQVATYNGAASIINNAASSRVYGLDEELRYEVVKGLELTLGASYLNARFNQYTDSTAYGLGTISSINASGFHMPLAPEFTGNLGARYTMDVGGGRLSLSGNLYETAKYYFDSSNQFVNSAHAILGLRAGWTDPSGRYTFSLYGDNVTDSHYLTQVEPSQLGIGTVWAAPATYGGDIRVKF
jgi:iron complex outermembrane recepter protein